MWLTGEMSGLIPTDSLSGCASAEAMRWQPERVAQASNANANLAYPPRVSVSPAQPQHP